jgi:hypothetical protein
MAPVVILGTPFVALGVLFGAISGSIVGGVAGGTLDASTGAAFDYAPEITVIVKPRSVEQNTNGKF